MRTFLISVVVLCSVGVLGTYDAEVFSSKFANCKNSYIYLTHRCEEIVVEAHPLGILTLGSYELIRSKT